MKKSILLLVVVILGIILQGCGSCDSSNTHPERYKPTGVIQLDSKNSETITGYNFSIVDTTGGFVTVPVGFNNFATNQGQPALEIKQVKLVEEMLREFQKNFKVKIKSYEFLLPYSSSFNCLYIRVFFEPSVNPQIQSLIKSNDELKTQNETLQSTVKALNTSIKQTKNQIKKMIETQK